MFKVLPHTIYSIFNKNFVLNMLPSGCIFALYASQEQYLLLHGGNTPEELLSGAPFPQMVAPMDCITGTARLLQRKSICLPTLSFLERTAPANFCFPH
jgi:hypothetical protein